MSVLEQLLGYLLAISYWSVSFALVLGGLIGLIAGIVKRSIRQTLSSTLLGSFLGTLVIGFIPIFSIPGLIKGWDIPDGRTQSLLVVFVPMGTITGAIIGAQSGLSRRKLWAAIPVAYLLLIIGILVRIWGFGSR